MSLFCNGTTQTGTGTLQKNADLTDSDALPQRCGRYSWGIVFSRGKTTTTKRGREPRNQTIDPRSDESLSAPEVRSVWKEHGLSEYLRTELGSDFGLVRALFFDKPPGKTWSLSWHKDLSIAVQDNSIASNFFNRPTNKLGVPHVIASDAILQSMLTLRIHLDRTSVENGALKVVPESHLSSVSEGVGCEHSVLIEADAGEVLAMRPLTTHSSGASHSNTAQHRRILHLEFASSRSLPDGYQWYDFVSGS